MKSGSSKSVDNRTNCQEGESDDEWGDASPEMRVVEFVGLAAIVIELSKLQRVTWKGRIEVTMTSMSSGRVAMKDRKQGSQLSPWHNLSLRQNLELRRSTAEMI